MINSVWLFDRNRRSYPRDENGKKIPGRPAIWRKHWYQCEVIDETSRSWVLCEGTKVPKKGAEGVAFSEEQIDELEFVHNHRHIIADYVRRLGYTDLKKVAEIIGYKSEN